MDAALRHLGKGGELGGIHSGCGGDVDHQQVLTGEVEREVLMRLKETHLANPLCADRGWR